MFDIIDINKLNKHEWFYTYFYCLILLGAILLLPPIHVKLLHTRVLISEQENSMVYLQ